VIFDIGWEVTIPAIGLKPKDQTKTTATPLKEKGAPNG